MKPLILMLLVATYAAAQKPTIADIARQERARRGQSNSTKVYTTADIKTPAPKGTEPTPTAAPAPAAAPAVTSTAAAAPAPAATTSTPAATAPPKEPVPAPAAGPDLVQQWTIETEKLRTQIRELIDQEAVAQLDINVIMNRVNAPVTSVGERDRALKDLEVAQNKLTATRDQLLRKRSELQARELQGPPRK
ncbi:MAG TPA: hypothetical protein VMT78_09115 [Terriglobia bacterium]|jgi:hypothetical protein|nr:hypothetical protein [Terriglobia bacterium]